MIIGATFSETRVRNENFGSSLLLANSPMSPKIVNGSFAAIYDTSNVFNKCMKTFGQLRLDSQNSPGMHDFELNRMKLMSLSIYNYKHYQKKLTIILH